MNNHEKVYIFGHQKPDTDSVCSAISLAYLKRCLGINATPRILGSVNNETKFVLDYFKVKTPKYLNDVRGQIRDVSYLEDYYVFEDTSIWNSYKLMNKNNASGVPVVDKDKKLTGLVTNLDITKMVLDKSINTIDTKYEDILKVLDAKEVLKFDDEISGKIITSVSSRIPLGKIDITSDTILITDNEPIVISYAIHAKAKLIILVNDAKIERVYDVERARKNKINIISTKLNSFEVDRLIMFSNYIKTIVNIKDIISFDPYTYISDFNIVHGREKYTNYPIVDKQKVCLGMLRVDDISNKTKKKVILVDHNLKDQSVIGLDEAEIIEVIDHHNLGGTLSTSTPISFRNMTVGSTCTIVYNMYLENHIEMPRYIAGLIMSGILSDTLILKSPTTTDMDREIVKHISSSLGINYEEYGLSMFKAGSSLENKKIEDIILDDFKHYNINNNTIGIGQVYTTNFDDIKERLDEYISSLDELTNVRGYLFSAIFVTDIIRDGSYIIFSSNADKYLKDSYDLEIIEEGHFFEGFVSRKKQMLPPILELLERK